QIALGRLGEPAEYKVLEPAGMATSMPKRLAMALRPLLGKVSVHGCPRPGVSHWRLTAGIARFETPLKAGFCLSPKAATDRFC
ncbi:MAG: hypothetical protein AAAB23_23780, partial [Pseudomonas sp.]